MAALAFLPIPAQNDNVVIPEETNGYPVTSIGSSAFPISLPSAMWSFRPAITSIGIFRPFGIAVTLQRHHPRQRHECWRLRLCELRFHELHRPGERDHWFRHTELLSFPEKGRYSRRR